MTLHKKTILAMFLALLVLLGVAIHSWSSKSPLLVTPQVVPQRPDPLWSAIDRGGSLDEVRRLVEARPTYVTEKIYGATALYYAVARNEADAARFLLGRGADPDARVEAGGDGEGNTPMIAAVENRNTAMVNLLCQYHADLNVRDKYGRSLMELAADSPEMKRLLAAKNVH